MLIFPTHNIFQLIFFFIALFALWRILTRIGYIIWPYGYIMKCVMEIIPKNIKRGVGKSRWYLTELWWTKFHQCMTLCTAQCADPPSSILLSCAFSFFLWQQYIEIYCNAIALLSPKKSTEVFRIENGIEQYCGEPNFTDASDLVQLPPRSILLSCALSLTAGQHWDLLHLTKLLTVTLKNASEAFCKATVSAIESNLETCFVNSSSAISRSISFGSVHNFWWGGTWETLSKKDQ